MARIGKPLTIVTSIPDKPRLVPPPPPEREKQEEEVTPVRTPIEVEAAARQEVALDQLSKEKARRAAPNKLRHLINRTEEEYEAKMGEARRLLNDWV